LAKLAVLLAQRPRQPGLWQARFLLLVALRRIPEAVRAGRAWAELLRPGIERAALDASLRSLETRGDDAAVAELWERARFFRQRGETRELGETLLQIRRRLPHDAGVCWALGELHASPGRCYDRQAASSELRRFLELLEAGDPPHLERLLPAPPAGSQARRQALRWIVQLENDETVFPPPVVDRQWLADEISAVEARQRSQATRIKALQGALTRLAHQLSTMGDPRRKDGAANRQQIRSDMERNRQATQRLTTEMAATERRLRDLRGLRVGTGR
jgi:hypothetical protein